MSFVRRAQIPWIATLLGVLATLAVFRLASLAEETSLRGEFERRSQIIANTIDLSLRQHEDALYSLRSLYHYSDSVSREEFAGAAGDILRQHSGIAALEWVGRVPDNRRTEVEAAIRAEGFADFQFLDRDKGNVLRRAADRPEHFPVIFVHPYSSHKVALGFDLVSGRTWPELQKAGRQNTLVSSGRLSLISDGQGENWGYLFEVPVYKLPVPEDPEQRWAALRGFVVGIFRMDQVIDESILRINAKADDLDVLILDRGVPTERQFLYYRPAHGPPPPTPPSTTEMEASPLHQMTVLAVPGRTWEIHFRANAIWLAGQRRHESLYALLVGIAGSIFLGVYLRDILRRTELIEREVQERTRQLRATEVQLQGIVDHSPAIIFLKDSEGRHLLCNTPYSLICGRSRSEIVGHTDHELFDRALADSYRASDEQVTKTGRPVEFERTVETADGPRALIVQKFPLLDEAGRVYAVCGIATDITGRKQEEEKRLLLERQLFESQKLESLGVLAGGIAHDFNNILTAILGNASLASLELPANHVVRPQLRQIELAARRAGDLCAQMLTYAGKAAFVTAPVNLTSLVHETAALLEVTLGKRTRLELRTESVPAVLGDATQLRQIVMNLVINATDAIGDRPDGLVTIRTFTRELPVDFFAKAVQNPALNAGRYVGLEVRDNGNGMRPEVLARIFEPFFTTKFSGRGLGLAAVLGIIQSHSGALFVETTAGQGTTFRFFLPASNVEPGHPPSAAARTQPALRGTVLVVDDEEAVRSVAALSLRAAGVQALEANDGETALRIYREQKETIDMILLDLTMPGIGGDETLRQLRAISPQLPVVVMSGYSEGETMRRCASFGVAGYLPKPFEIADLLARIQPHLSGTAGKRA